MPARRRRGAILPLFAVTLVMLLSVVGLALDGAYAAAAGRDLQSIADYGARVAADRASKKCIEAPGVVCPLDLAEATAALSEIKSAWATVESSLVIDAWDVTTAGAVTNEDGTTSLTQVVVTVKGCHAPLLLGFLFDRSAPAPCGDSYPNHLLALTATGVSNVGSGH